MLNFVLKLCDPDRPDSLKTTSLFYRPVSFSSRTVKMLAQDFIATNCGEFIDKDEWPPNSPVDYHVLGATLERYKTFNPKQRNIEDLKNVLQVIWDQLPQVSINKAIVSFTKRIRVCLKADGEHFEHCLAINLKR